MKKFNIIILFIFFLLPLSAQNMYVIIVTHSDVSIGSLEDKKNMTNLMEYIKEKVPDLNVEVINISDNVTSKERIKEELAKLNVSSNDVLWFYYSGHGKNYDNWPMTDSHDVPETWVSNQLSDNNARLTITIYDSCNWGQTLSQPMAVRFNPNNYIKNLLLYSSGDIKISSSSPGKFSFGTQSNGSFFTNAFIDAIKHGHTWNKILRETRSTTIKMAKSQRKIQKPIYEFSTDFLDVRYQTQNQ